MTSAVSVATSLTIVACLVGYFISRNRRWRGTVTAVITFPSLAPAITVIYGVLLVLSPLGPLNHLIVNGLHLSAAPVRLTGTMVAVPRIDAGCRSRMPRSVLLAIASMKPAPSVLVEIRNVLTSSSTATTSTMFWCVARECTSDPPRDSKN